MYMYCMHCKASHRWPRWSHKLILSQKIKKESNLLSTARTMQWKGHRKVHLNLLMKMLPKILLEAWAEPFSSHYCSKKNQNCPKNCLPPKSLNCKAPWKNDCFSLYFTWPFWAPLLVKWLCLVWERHNGSWLKLSWMHTKALFQHRKSIGQNVRSLNY